MELNLTDMLKTANRYGNLMPSYLSTPYSDAAIREGLCEVVCDGNTGGHRWIRLTDRGKNAAENVRAGGGCFTVKDTDETDGDPIGWTIVSTGDDGSVLCESPSGNRRRYWFHDRTNGDQITVGLQRGKSSSEET